MPPAPTPALLITTVGGPPNQDCASLAEHCEVVELRYVAAQRRRLAAIGDDRVGRGACRRLVDVAAHHAAASFGEFDGECGTDAAACAGDDGRGVVAASLGRSERTHARHPAARSIVVVVQRL